MSETFSAKRSRIMKELWQKPEVREKRYWHPWRRPMEGKQYVVKSKDDQEPRAAQ